MPCLAPTFFVVFSYKYPRISRTSVIFFDIKAPMIQKKSPKQGG